MGDIKRVSLNGETLRILIEAEMSKHLPCRGCTRWSIEPVEPDENGCNWKLNAGASEVVSSGCFDKIASYISFLKANFGLDNAGRNSASTQQRLTVGGVRN